MDRRDASQGRRDASPADRDARRPAGDARHRVFVYGTLKEGFPNFATNRGRRVPGEFVTLAPHRLYLVGPRAVPWLLVADGQGQPVAGQVFEVDDATLADMDRLEGVGRADGYLRVPVEVRPAGECAAPAQTVFAYLKPAAQLTDDLPRDGPLAAYSIEHAARYRRP